MKSVILLGPKHCGKTTVGKELTSLLSCEFIDLDEEIEKQTGKTPRELYREGAEIFKIAETESLKQFDPCSLLPASCLATGGGIIDNEKAVELIKKTDSIKVYLNICADTAWQRILAAGELPPFLQTDNPKETHRALHERRAESYRQLADIVIETENKTPQDIASVIIDKLNIV